MVSTNPSSIRISSYNVKNMFAQEDLTPGSRTKPKSDWEMKALAEVMTRTDADVVALQEVSSRKTLQSFLNNNGLNEVYPHVAHIPSKDERGINVAVISKYPFETVITHQDEQLPRADGKGTTEFSRDFLRVDINTDNQPGAELTVYNTHSKSRRPAGPGDDITADTQRLSEGQAMRRIAENEMKEFPGRLFVLTGDFNDNTDDASVQAILNPKNGGEQWLDSLDHLAAGDRNTWPANPKASHGHDPEQFDHIIYPKSMDDRLIKSEVHRYNESLDGTSYKWLSSAASDHLNISADFKL